jgi:heat-inducible transcriptional repressor
MNAEPRKPKAEGAGLDDLDARKQQVLKAVVHDYTVTAVPVGSQALAARYFERWSSATIRNELARLMDSGHLRQPHTSSGRIPSDLGYRYFVDYLMEEEPLEPGLRTSLQKFYNALPADIEAILEGTAMVLARTVESVGVVTAPRTSECKLKYVDLVHLAGPKILALVVLEGNLVRQQPLVLPADVEQESLGSLSARLNEAGKGMTRIELQAALAALDLVEWERAAADGIAQFMEAYDAQTATVVVHDGVRNLVKQPEFVDADKLLPVLELLEQSTELARVLEGVGSEVEVLIGDENPDDHLRDCSVVMTTYTAASTRGTLGTIGPTRIRYPQVVVRVRYISKLASDALARLYS